MRILVNTRQKKKKTIQVKEIKFPFTSPQNSLLLFLLQKKAKLYLQVLPAEKYR